MTVIRPVEISDAEALWECECALVREGVGMVLTEDDLGTLEQYRSRVLSRITDRIWFGAVVEERLVGEVSVTPLTPGLCAHVGVLTVGIHPNAQGRGLGRRLCEVALSNALVW